MLKWALIFLLIQSPLQAMVAGYNYENKDFIELANRFQESKSCCAIISHDAASQLSGVLITPNIVATAAHGLVDLLNKTSIIQNKTGFIEIYLEETYVQFDENTKIRVKSAYIDQRYVFEEKKTEYGKYDIAFLSLEHPLKDRPFIPLEQTIEIPKEATFIVISHGNSDLSNFWEFLTFWKPRSTFLKRAFALLEWTPFVHSTTSKEDLQLFRTLLYSSIFFDGRKTYRPYALDDNPIHQRTMDAILSWQNNEYLPFALALPGTSGSPLFLKIGNKLHLIGLVVAYAPIEGVFLAPKGTSELDQILRDPKNAIGKYQTIFALFYKENISKMPSITNAKSFILDPTLQKFLN